MSDFLKNLSQQIQTFPIDLESPIGSILKQSQTIGEQVEEKIGQPLTTSFLKATTKLPKTAFSFFQNISRIGGAVASRYGLFAEGEPKPFTPREGATNITEALSNEPYLSEVVSRGISKTPLGKIPLVAPVGGFLSEFLLPPYGAGKGVSIIDDLAKITTKKGTREIVERSFKELSENEVSTLTQKLTPITDKKVIRNELQTFFNNKKQPQITTQETQNISKQAIEYAKQNPNSSLATAKFTNPDYYRKLKKGELKTEEVYRNPYTKQQISGTPLFKRIGESLRNQEINITDLPLQAQKYGLNAEQTAQLFEEAASYSGRTLQALSRVEKELQKLFPDIIIPKRLPTLWEKFKVGYQSVDNFRRGLLVTQLATAMRNAVSQTGRYATGTITDAMNGVISKITGQGEGFTPFFKDISAVLRKTNKENRTKIQEILQNFPLENARLYNTPVGDVALANKITNTLNTFNRGQEYFFRNLILDAKLHSRASIKGVSIEKLDIEDFKYAVDEALEWTFSKSPETGSFGNAIMKTYQAMPPLTLINPFPRFMSNSVKFLYDYSPTGIMSLFSKKSREKIASGDFNAISKAIVGTTMLGSALVMRSNKNIAGEKWYEIKVGDKTIDTRPFAPFSTYLFFAEVMLNGGKNIDGKDWALAMLGINRVAGTGLALLDLFKGNVDYKNAKDVVNNIISTYVGGFTVPFVTIKDVISQFKLDERFVRETREIPVIGGAIGNIPLLNNILPEKYSMFEDKVLEREYPLLRQLTGLSITTKPFILKELNRMGKNITDLIPKTGNLQANRIITKQTGIILDKFNDELELSKKYGNMIDSEKLNLLGELISTAKSEAKGEIARDLAIIVYNELKKVSGEKRKEILNDLNKRGLLTENIQDYLIPILESNPIK